MQLARLVAVSLGLAAAGLLAVPGAGAQPEGDYAAIDTWVREAMAQEPIPGLDLAIVHGSAVVHLQGFGVADPSGRRCGVPVRPAVFAGGSGALPGQGGAGARARHL